MGTLAAAAAGGTPRPRPDQTWRTPPPNVVAPGGAAGIFRGRLIVLYGSGRGVGLFQYNGTPALGNPPILYSVPPGVTEDPYGNTLPETHGGLWSVSGISVSGLYQGTVQTGVETDYTLAAFVAESGLSWITSGAKSSGDTETILYLSSAVGTGTGRAQLSKNAPLVATDPNTSVGAAETWHAMTLAAGWTNVTGFAPASYRLNALGNVELAGRITGTISGSTNFGSLPSPYYSTTYSRAYAANVDASAGITPSETPHIRCYTTGALNVTGLANGTATVDLDGTFMLSRG